LTILPHCSTLHRHQHRQMKHLSVMLNCKSAPNSISEDLSIGKGLQNHCTPNSNTINIKPTTNSYTAKEH
jgi:hypothetical protein